MRNRKKISVLRTSRVTSHEDRGLKYGGVLIPILVEDQVIYGYILVEVVQKPCSIKTK